MKSFGIWEFEPLPAFEVAPKHPVSLALAPQTPDPLIYHFPAYRIQLAFAVVERKVLIKPV
jgi:hypothetical protein